MKLMGKPQLLITFVPATIVLAIIAIVSVQLNISMTSITRDVTAIGNIHPLSGILSSLGILIWCAAASIAYFAAGILRSNGRTAQSWFLLNSAFLTSYLLFDDLFQFHESLAPMYFGFDENVGYAILGIVTLIYLVRYRKTILETDFSALLLAFALLSTSVFVDEVSRWLWRLGDWEYFLEDGFKWLGIVAWCSYFVKTSYTAITNPG